MDDTRSRLRRFIQSELARDRAGLNVDEEPLVESGIIDSLGIMKLVEFLEKEFSIKISDDELVPDNFETLDDIERLVAAKRG